MNCKSASVSTRMILAAAVRQSLSTLHGAIFRIAQRVHRSAIPPLQSWFASDVAFSPAPSAFAPTLMETLEHRQLLSSTHSWSTYTASSPASQAPQAIMQVLAPVKMVGAVISVDATTSTFGDGSAITTNYTWNFGDSSGAYNVLSGYNASHVYNSPGTYTLSLTLTNDLHKTSTVSTTVTIAADTRKVIYVDSSAGNDSNSGLTPSTAVQSAIRADALLGNNTEVLFKRGETFTLTQAFETPYTNVLVGAYGSGALPVLSFTGNVTNDVVLDTSTNDLSIAVTFEDLSITSPSSVTNLPMAIMARASDEGVIGCVFNHVMYAVNANGGALGLLVQDCSSPSTTGLWGYFVWDQSTDVSVLGNYVAGIGGEHVFRSEQGSGEMNIAYNNFTNNDGKGDIEIHWGSFAWVDHNTCNGGDVRVGPLGLWGESASSNTTDAVIEDNTIQNGSTVEVQPGSHDISIRSNYISTSDSIALISLESGDSQGRTTYDVQILNNTGYTTSNIGNFINVESSMSGIVMENNLYLAPNLIPGAYNTSPVWVTGSDLSSFTAINGNVWQLPATIYSFANGGKGINFVGTALTSTGYLTPATWNAEPQVGTDYFVATTTALSGTASPTIADGASSLTLSVLVPVAGTVAATADSPVAGVFTDFNGNIRPTSGTWSAGAVQTGTSASTAEVINLNETSSGSSSSGSSSSGGSSSGGSTTATPLPSGWTSADIGSVGSAGSASYSNGTYTISGSGADISGTADAFHFVYTTLSGDGSIVAQISGQTDANSSAKAGLMFRDGTAANAAEVSISMDPTGLAHFDARSTAGGNTSYTSMGGLTSTEWLKLVRAGSTITAYVSSDDKTWTMVNSATISMSTTLEVGLVVSAHNNAAIETANFSGVAVASALPSGWTAADIGAVGAAGSTTYSNGAYTVTGSGADISGTADAFQFVYTTLTGNGSIVAEVSGETDANNSAKAGVMIRDGLAANAKEVSISKDPTGLAHLDARTSVGASTAYSSVGGLSSTEWLKLVRNGSTVTTFISTDDKTWTQTSSTTLTLDSTLEIGLAVSAHDAGALETAMFSNVSVSSSIS
jgi:regulation of enolase protein 1 (concanavalin A-like superfamily)